MGRGPDEQETHTVSYHLRPFAHFFRANREVSELEIALLFLLCVASFAAFLFALSPRLYCEGVDEMGDIISFDLQICSS